MTTLQKLTLSLGLMVLVALCVFAADPVAKFPAVSVDGTASVNQLIATNGATINGPVGSTSTFGGPVYFTNYVALGGTTNRVTDSGTNLTRNGYSITMLPLGGAASDETTAITATAGKLTFRSPGARRIVGVRASLTTAQASGNIFTVDINESNSSILSTKLTIDNGEKTSVDATTPAVISDTELADDAEITVDVDQIGNGTATGLKVWVLTEPL